MRTDTGHVFHLSDYRPTDFVLESVDLTFRLDPKHTEVMSTLRLRRRPGAAADAPLVLDGDEVKLKRVEVDGAVLDRDRYEQERDDADPARHAGPGALHRQDRDRGGAGRQHPADGALPSRGVYCTQCEAEGFRRITYFLDRPDVLAVYTTRIEAPQGDGAGAAVATAISWRAAMRGRPALRRLARSASPSPPTCSRWSPAISASSRTASHGLAAARWRWGSMSSTARKPRAAYAMDALKRSMRWDEDASAANTISTSSTSSPSPTSTWARWRTRASTSSTTNTCSPTRTPRPTRTTPISRRSSRTSISTTGPATESPAATGSSSA